MIERWILLAAVIPLFCLGSMGCITRAGGQLAPIETTAPSDPAAIEYVVGDFEFTLEGGKMVTSNKAGRVLSDEIFKIWKKRGYISEFTYVGESGFSSQREHQLTLSGSQYGDSSIAAQILSGLTLFLIPYTVDTKYDIQYLYENARTGARCSAEVADSYHTTVELLLFLAAPFSTRGMQKTMGAMGDHVYDQLHRGCGFGK
jgi:hypothetical protein